MARITLSGDRWLDVTPMLVDDELEIADLTEVENDFKGQVAFLRGLRDIVDRHTIAASWDGGAGRLTKAEMYSVLGQIRVVTEDDALPPANGTSSETP